MIYVHILADEKEEKEYDAYTGSPSTHSMYIKNTHTHITSTSATHMNFANAHAHAHAFRYFFIAPFYSRFADSFFSRRMLWDNHTLSLRVDNITIVQHTKNLTSNLWPQHKGELHTLIGYFAAYANAAEIGNVWLF